MEKFYRWFDETISFPIRRNALVRNLYPLLKGCKKVLDLGASCGRLAKGLMDHLPNVEFYGVDTHVQPVSHIPVVSYDGETLPFDDNTFDCVMMVDVLHHAENPKRLIEEAKRVSKGYILIKDHYWRNILHIWALKIYDLVGNKPYGIPLAQEYFKVNQWEALFRKSGVSIMKQRQFRYHFGDPCPHLYFLLETA